MAFGTFLGVPEPENFFGDASYVKTRWLANRRAAFAAEIDGEVVGSNFAPLENEENYSPTVDFWLR